MTPWVSAFIRCSVHRLAAPVLLSILLAAALSIDARAQECRAPEPVCALRATVFAVSAFDPLGSAVRVGADLLVTNRHIVADRLEAKVFLPDGTPLAASVVPASYAGDLIFLRVPNLGQGPIAAAAELTPAAALHSVGADAGLRRVVAYPPGRLLLAPPDGRPRARLHHTAYSQPGNSGGALSDGDGRLVGIVTSGGSGSFEAIPAAEIARLQALSGPAHLARSQAIGRAYRGCVLALEEAREQPGRLAPSLAEQIAEDCRATDNRQMFDDAGRALGRGGFVAESIALFEESLARDPNAINARLSILVSLHLARRYAEELPHIEWLMELRPDDAQVLRFGIQAGKWAGDLALAQRALVLLEKHHPRVAPLARDFLANDQPPPGSQ